MLLVIENIHYNYWRTQRAGRDMDLCAAIEIANH